MKQSIKLTKEYAQFAKNHTGKLESALSITVMYEPIAKEVEYVYSVTVYNYEKKVHTDISAIMGQNMEDMLNDMTDSINWSEVYADTKIEEALS